MRNGSDYKQIIDGKYFGICPRNAQFFIYPVFNPEKRWFRAPYFQSKETESIFKGNQIQTYLSSSNPRFLTAKRLDGQNRYHTGLLPCASSTVPSVLSKNALQGPTTSNDLFAIWACNRSQSVCVSLELDRRNSKRARDSNRSFSRRLPDRFSGQAEVDGADEDRSQDPSRFRMDCQHVQVNTSSSEIIGISRSNMGYVEKQKNLARKENSRLTGHYNKTPQTTKSDVSRSSKHCGDIEFCPASCATGSIKLSWPPEPFQLPATEQFRKEGSFSFTDYQRTGVVDAELREVDSTSSSASDPFSHNRRSRHGMGRRVERRAGTGRLVERRRVSSFESKRNVNYFEMLTPIRSFSESFVSVASMRQQISRGLSEKRGRKPIGTADEFDLSDFQNYRSFRYSLSRTSHSGKVQRCRRSPVSKVDTSRVASTPFGNRGNFSKMGSPRNRSVRVGTCPRRTEICQSRSEGPRSLETQRVCLGMEVQASVDIPPSESNAESPYASQSSDRNIFNCSAEVASGILESGSKGSCHSTPIHSPPVRIQTNRLVDGPSSTKNTGADARNLEMWGWSEAVESWSTQQKALLRAGWRESTLNTYKPAWARWVKWCQNSSVNPTNPSGSELAKFLADLHLKEKLAYRTILVHKSVVSTLCTPKDSCHLSSNILVKQILKSIATSDSMTRTETNIWDTNIVISWLSNRGLSVQSVWEVSRRCAILLLLCSGRRVHDLTLLNVSNSNFLDNTDADCLTFWPIYGSKTDTASYTQSGWKLYANKENPNIDPVLWVRKLVQIGRDRRREGKVGNLFVTARGPAKAASRTVIAGWVKSVLSEAGVDATPGSVRSAVASRGWIDREPLDKILSRANWRSENTFSKFYKKEIRSIPNANSNSLSLGTLFEPVR